MKKYPRYKNTKTNQAFTMIEIMVALVILAVGLLGMAGMTMVVMRGNRGAEDLANATNICQQKIEELKDIPWADLGDATSGAADEANGLKTEGILQETDLNAQGLTRAQLFTQQQAVAGSVCSTGTDTLDTPCGDYLDQAGPYKYTRSFAVCRGDDYTLAGSTVVPPSWAGVNLLGYSPTYSAEPNCMVDPVSNAGFRPQPLACEDNDILTVTSSPEKMIKILCTWRTKEGRCNYVNFEALRMNNL